MKKIISICLALLLAAALCGSAMAAAAVNYEGGAEKFVFIPGSEYSDSDLFENFKDVLPGDTLTQTIRVQNDTDKQVRIYLRAEPVEDMYEDFLSQLNMVVECKDKEIFDAEPSKTAQLTNNTLLGTFKKAGSTELTLTLTVPAEMGNQYMGAIGVVPWTFMVEEIPEDPSVHTGDWFQAGLWIGAAALLAAAVIVLIVLQRKRRKEA